MRVFIYIYEAESQVHTGNWGNCRIWAFFGYMIHFRDFWDVLDAINWDRVRLYVSWQVLKIWSACVDLLGNISTCFGMRKGENRPKTMKKHIFYSFWCIVETYGSFQRSYISEDWVYTMFGKSWYFGQHVLTSWVTNRRVLVWERVKMGQNQWKYTFFTISDAFQRHVSHSSGHTFGKFQFSPFFAHFQLLLS